MCTPAVALPVAAAVACCYSIPLMVTLCARMETMGGRKAEKPTISLIDL
jgi:hypothetical protein